MEQITRYDVMPKPVKVLFLIFVIIGVGLFIVHVFGFSLRGYFLPTVAYFYLLFALYGFCIFVALPARKKDRKRVPWYDLILAALAIGIATYWASNAKAISEGIWIPAPSTFDFALACIFGLLALEGGRRVAGNFFMVICLIFGAYPLFAEYMPGVLYGIGLPFPRLASFFAFGSNGILGVPALVIGGIIIGFLLFAGVLIGSGAGDFFLKLALALLGRFRGGPAKVAVIASGFFGSLSGNPIANVASTGSVTIPAMKRLGYPPHYAGAIEACASTGGAIMPPIMGSIAFVMVAVTEIPYATIVTASFIPALLYYYGLLVQVDAYAARVGLKGIPREELPSVKETLKEGWPFIAVIIFLVWGLVYMRWSYIAPIYASGLMVLLSFANRKTMITPRRLIKIVVTVGGLITWTMAILLPVGLILSGLFTTGMTAALTAKVISLGGENLILILLLGIVVCYVMGMAGMGLLAYIFLAVTMVPAVITTTGLDMMAVHLFVVYYALTGNITPPVAIAAFVAAGFAGAPAMKTAITSMRLAIVLYFIPFFFLFNPALILRGSALETLYLFALCLLGILILAGGLEGHLLKVGRLKGWERPLLVATGFMIALPPWAPTFITWMPTIIGVALTVLIITIILVRKGKWRKARE